MAQIEQLDSILRRYYEIHVMPAEAGMQVSDFAKIAKEYADESNTYEINKLYNKLKSDEYLEMNESKDYAYPELTRKGFQFYLSGGYSLQELEKNKKRTIQKNTIQKFKYDKISLLISILAILISIFSIFYKR